MNATFKRHPLIQTKADEASENNLPRGVGWLASAFGRFLRSDFGTFLRQPMVTASQARGGFSAPAATTAIVPTRRLQ